MDFTETETQTVLAELTASILRDAGAIERIKAAEAAGRDGDDGIDAVAWSALADTGVLGALAEDADIAAGQSTGVVDAAMVCRAHGRTLAQVPLWTTAAGLLSLRHLGAGSAPVSEVLVAVANGDARVTVALAEPGRLDPLDPDTVDHDGRLTGNKMVVVDGAGARFAVTAAASAESGVGLYLVDLEAPGVARRSLITTDRRPAAHLDLCAAPASRLGGSADLAWALGAARTLVSATQAGVCGQAIHDTAAFLGTRHQFGRPLSSFQSPVHRLADAFIECEAIWLTTLLAAWRLDRQLDATSAVDVAGWWAADAGSRAVHTTQHLHGGIGADVDYPIHRPFLWAKQLADTLGGAGSHLSHLGRTLADAECS